MKKSTKSITAFLFGAITMCGLLILMQCNKEDDTLFDEYKQSELEANIDIDYKGIKNTFSEIEDHFNNADLASLRSMLSEDSKALYDESTGQYSDEEMAAIANALKKSKTTVATEDFAELTYSINDVEYTITIGLVEEGNWEIIRF